MDSEQNYVHVTPDMVTAYIKKVEYFKIGERTRLCLLTTVDDMEVVGKAVHQKSIEDDEAIGNDWAYKNAFDQTYPLAIVYYNK